MIGKAVFPVEPWQVREATLGLDLLAQTESVFALSNGHIGLRGNLDEGEPHAILGSYLNSLYEQRPLPYPEGGYGYPEQGQTVINVTDGKLVRLMVDDEQFNVSHGRLLSHERVLDLRSGLLQRSVDWVSPAGRRVRIRSSRLVSFTQRAVAAIDYEVEAVDHELRITAQSDLVANEEQPQTSDDPRVAAALDRPLVAVEQDTEQHGAVLLHRTRVSGLLMSAGMDHLVDGGRRLRRGNRRTRRLGPHHDSHRAAPRRTAAHHQVPRLRVELDPLPAGAARPGRRRAHRRAVCRLARPHG